MDRQTCPIILQSSAHTKEEISYNWKRNARLDFVQGIQYQDEMMPDLTLQGYRIRRSRSLPDQLTGGRYDQVVLELIMERQLGYYIWEVMHTYLVFMNIQL